MPSNEVKTRCPAKVNLTFEILDTLPDGYHKVCTLLQTVSLEDELTFEFSKNNWEFENSKSESYTSKISYDSYESEFHSEFPMDESNLISKAIRKYQDVVSQSKNFDVSIRIIKRIPIGSGLAGGSANAAAALVAINHFFDDKLSHRQLLELGSALGADVPFSLQGGTCIGTHKGEILQKLDETSKLVLLLAKPRSLTISTPWAFKQFDQEEMPLPANSTVYGTTLTSQNRQVSATKLCAEAISILVNSSTTPEILASRFSCESKPRTLARHLRNDFEPVIFSAYKELEEVRQTMEDFGALVARLTGSGPTLYALVQSHEHAQILKDKLVKLQSENEDSKIFPLDFWITESISRGARVMHNETHL